MASKPPVIDLDAHRRESVYPDGISLVFGGEQYVLPSQFPLETLDPFLAEELGLVGIIRDFMVQADDKADTTQIFDTLVAHPTLPKQAIGAVLTALEVLFGEEQFERFQASSARPGVGDYLFIARNLIGAYGVTLGEAFASPESSENDGATPNLTSPDGAQPSTSNESGSAAEQLAEQLAEVGVVEPVWDEIPVQPVAHILPVPTPVPVPVPVPVPTPQG